MGTLPCPDVPIPHALLGSSRLFKIAHLDRDGSNPPQQNAPLTGTRPQTGQHPRPTSRQHEVAGIKSTRRADIAPVFLTGRRLRRLRRLKAKSPERSGLQLDVKAALPIGKAAAIEIRLSSETLAVT
jgi:hypothetical protein